MACASVAAGFFDAKYVPGSKDLLDLERWFEDRGISVDMGNGVGGRISSFKRIRSKIILSPNDGYYSLYGNVNKSRSEVLEDCWEAYAGIGSKDGILVDATADIDPHLFRRLSALSCASHFVLSYQRDASRFDDAQLSDLGLCTYKMTQRIREQTSKWAAHLRSGAIGSKLRDVYSVNGFRPERISLKSCWLEDWISNSKLGSLSFDDDSGLLCWTCAGDEISTARDALAALDALVT